MPVQMDSDKDLQGRVHIVIKVIKSSFSFFLYLFSLLKKNNNHRYVEIDFPYVTVITAI